MKRESPTSISGRGSIESGGLIMNLYKKRQKLLKIKLELEKQLKELENFIDITNNENIIKNIYEKIEESVYDLQDYIQFLE